MKTTSLNVRTNRFFNAGVILLSAGVSISPLCSRFHRRRKKSTRWKTVCANRSPQFPLFEGWKNVSMDCMRPSRFERTELSLLRDEGDKDITNHRAME